MSGTAPRKAADGLPPLGQVIAELGLGADRRLGQNFLTDLNLTGRIAREAGDLTGSDVLEIGPGPGGLTRALLAAGARHVVAIEKDARFAPALQAIAAHWPGRLTVLEGDALEVDPLPHLTPPVRIVANLPYNVGTELLVRWLTPPAWPPFWQGLTLMFQKEVARRITARPGEPAYGRLAVLAAWRTRARIVMELPPEAFVPPPKVRSAVVRLDALPEPVCAADQTVLLKLTKAAFGQRRKMLRASLKGLHPRIVPLMEQAGIAPTARPETLSVADFCALARLLADDGAAAGSGPGKGPA